MLTYILAASAAAQAPAAVAAPPAVPAPAVTAKAKKTPTCDKEEQELGSHIVTCNTDDEYEQLRKAHQAEQSLNYSSDHHKGR